MMKANNTEPTEMAKMKKYTAEELKSILDAHNKWLIGDEGCIRADLFNADLEGAGLEGIDLSGADLSAADLSGADLSGAQNIDPTESQKTSIVPKDGAFIGWKKAYTDTGIPVVIKMKITRRAKRSNATGRKCRCSKAKVLSIESITDKKVYSEVFSTFDSSFVYCVGETVEVSDFDDNRWRECTTGIHFFITKAEAIDYHIET